MMDNYSFMGSITSSEIRVEIIENKWLSGHTELKYINIIGDWFEVKDSCATHCLYYSNAYGGWDSLCINGNTKKTDNINGYTYTKKTDIVLNPRTFQTKKYLNEIKSNWVLNTGWLTDDEASRMYHLLESTDVFLQDLNNPDVLIPINITNTQCEYKTFTNNGKKKINYVIEAQEANLKIRR